MIWSTDVPPNVNLIQISFRNLESSRWFGTVVRTLALAVKNQAANQRVHLTNSYNLYNSFLQNRDTNYRLRFHLSRGGAWPIKEIQLFTFQNYFTFHIQGKVSHFDCLHLRGVFNACHQVITIVQIHLKVLFVILLICFGQIYWRVGLQPSAKMEILPALLNLVDRLSYSQLVFIIG